MRGNFHLLKISDHDLDAQEMPQKNRKCQIVIFSPIIWFFSTWTEAAYAICQIIYTLRNEASVQTLILKYSMTFYICSTLSYFWYENLLTKITRLLCLVSFYEKNVYLKLSKKIRAVATFPEKNKTICMHLQKLLHIEPSRV